MSALLTIEHAKAGYRANVVLGDVGFELHAGEVVGLVGPNGAGKSTFLRLAAGLLPPMHGEVRFEDRSLSHLPRREIAKRIAWLPQAERIDLAFAVRDVVSMGRFPHVGPFEPLADRDRQAIDRAVREAGIESLLDRSFPALSEGEKQRVQLARCLAQEPKVFLLDEPTASLDVRHAAALMKVVRDRAGQGSAVLAAIHDLMLAFRVCDRIVVLDKGAIARMGPPEQALSEEVLAATFGMRARLTREDDGAVVLRVC